MDSSAERHGEVPNRALRDRGRAPRVPFHRSKEIHDKRRRGTLGPLKQKRGTAFPQNPLRDFSCFQDGIYFDPDALKLPCCFEMRDKGLQISERHDA